VKYLCCSTNMLCNVAIEQCRCCRLLVKLYIFDNDVDYAKDSVVHHFLGCAARSGPIVGERSGAIITFFLLNACGKNFKLRKIISE